MNDYSLVIDGRCIATKQTQPVRNPVDHSVVGQMPVATQEHLNKAVDAAKAAFPAWSARPDHERRAFCHQIADKIERHAEDLAQLLTLEQGKPLNGLGSRFELGSAVAWARATADLTLPMEVLKDGPEGRVEVRHKPLGVVGSITPWSWPVMIACWHLIPAIRAGNTVVCKPSCQTPLAALRMVELMNSLLPPGVVNSVTGNGLIGNLLASHPAVDKMVFTGSTPTGKKVMEAASGTLKRLTLELGGNDASIVMPDVNPVQIAEGLFWGAFINSGQTCAAIKRLYVHESVYEAVCVALATYAAQVKMGDGRKESNVLGPMQSERQFSLVHDLVENARDRGGKILIGGNPGSGPGYFYPLTLVTNVDNGVRLVDEEQFGPALPIIKYSSFDEAISKANTSPFGLGGSVWASDVRAARKLATRLECGSIWVNRHGTIRPDTPFGGIKQSGFGVAFGADGLKEFTTIQTMLI